ncbi:MAG: PEGA domain-containing protein, partial [Acidobacteria bacterium]|nr:PEGA domain-containing protein [Acidobacteriota bacterium]
ALVIGAAALHGPVWALRAIGRTGSTVGRATLGGLTRVAQDAVLLALDTVLVARDTVLVARDTVLVARETVLVAQDTAPVPQDTVLVAQDTAPVPLVIGAAALHGPVWVLRAIGRTGGTVGRATLGGLTRVARGTVRAARGTVRAARDTARATYGIGSATFLVRQARHPLVGGQLVFAALLVIAVWPGMLLATPQGRGLLQLWIEDVESAAGKHRLAKVSNVVAPRPTALRVQSEPTGAQVWIDGVLKGETPLALDHIKQGIHTVVLRHASGSVRTTVRVGQGESADLLVPIYPGWLAVFASVELQILEGGAVIGTTESGRFFVRPGYHTVELVSARLGFRTTRTIEVKPGEVAALNVALPPAPLEIVAPQGSEIWVDGLLIGAAPLQPQSVAVGTRDVMMRHPVLGEQRQTTTVTYGTPNRVVFASPS